MAEIDIFAGREDLNAIASILANDYRCRFELDWTAVASPTPIMSSTGLVRHVEKANFRSARFAVVSPGWEQYPLSRTAITDATGSRNFFISFRYGGPAIDLVARLPQRRDSAWFLIPTLISDYPTYYPTLADGSRTLGLEFARPTMLVEAMNAVRRYILSCGIRTRTSKMKRLGPWALPEAMALHKEGMWLRIGDHKYEPRREG